MKFRDPQSNYKHELHDVTTFRFIRAEFSRSDVDGRSDFVVRSSSDVSDESSTRADEFDEDKVDSWESMGGDCFGGIRLGDCFIVCIGGGDGVGVTKAHRKGEERTFF